MTPALRLLPRNVLALVFSVLPALLPAQPAPGTITGRIANPATGEFVRNARVVVRETGVAAVSEGGGEYRLYPVAPGRVTLSVTYTGYRDASATVTVAAGATAASVAAWSESAATARPRIEWKKDFTGKGRR